MVPSVLHITESYQELYYSLDLTNSGKSSHCFVSTYAGDNLSSLKLPLSVRENGAEKRCSLK